MSSKNYCHHVTQAKKPCSLSCGKNDKYCHIHTNIVEETVTKQKKKDSKELKIKNSNNCTIYITTESSKKAKKKK